MRQVRTLCGALVILSALASPRLGAAAAGAQAGDDPAALTQDEADRLREAQDPSDRIQVYLELAGERLERFEALRRAPPSPQEQADRGATLDRLLSQYLALDDELKRWIQDQFDTGHDMRKGLRTLIDQAPKQLFALKQVEPTPDPYLADYRQSLRDAIDDLDDTLNGATEALANQEKKFSEMNREEKVEAKAAKEAAKEQKKREKEERKLRKKEEKHGIPEDEDQQN